MSGDEGAAAPRSRLWRRAGEARPTVVVRRASAVTGGRPLVAHEDGVRPPKGWPADLVAAVDARDGMDTGGGSGGDQDDAGGRADGGREDGDPMTTYVLWVDEGGAVQTGVFRTGSGSRGFASWVDHGLIPESRWVHPTPSNTRAAVARRLDAVLRGGAAREEGEPTGPVRQLTLEVDAGGEVVGPRFWRADRDEPALPERAALEAAREDVRVRTRLARSDRGLWSLVPVAVFIAPGLLANALAPAYVVPVVVVATLAALVAAVVVGDRLARWRTERLLAPLGAQRITVPGRP